MAIMNIPYDPRTDPKALFTQGAQNLIGGLMQGRQRRRLGEFAGGMDPEATAMQIVAAALSKGINPQMALGLGGLQQRMQPGIGNMPWAATQMTPPQRQNWLDNYGRGVTIQTGQKLLKPGQRKEIAETEFTEKVGVSSTERTNAKKGIEELFESVSANAWSYGWEDYSREKLIGMYKQWLTEQDYEAKTPRQKKSLDEIWDGKMNLMNKVGHKFKDKDRAKLSKNELDWDPNDPDVKKLREGQANTGLPKVGPEAGLQTSPTGMQQLPPTGTMLPSTLKPTREALLAEYRRLGGSKSTAARKFAEENGLLE